MQVSRYLIAASLLLAPSASAQDLRARAVVDSALARMGGRAALDSIRTVQYELMTQWLSLAVHPNPSRDNPSYERQTEWRDYGRKIWRNTRRSAVGSGWSEITDLVVDTIPARRFPPSVRITSTNVSTPALPIDGWVPLTVAYVDERRELFTWAPERVVPLLRDATDLRSRADTTIAGEPHAVVTATVEGWPFTAFFQKSTALPTMVRYVADETNDFGLAPWGPMEVEILYSRWTANPAVRATLPRQWDTRRVGIPYKRMSVLAATFNAPLPADSIAIADTVRRAYLAVGRRAMGDFPVDSMVPVAGGAVLAIFGSVAPAGAVRLGDEWVFLDGGNIPVSMDRVMTMLTTTRPAGIAKAGGAIVTTNRPGAAALWAARGGKPVHVGSNVSEATLRSLRNWKAPLTSVRQTARGAWITSRSGADSVWMEPLSLSNGPAMLVYVPSARWGYSGAAASQTDAELVARAIRARGWNVDRVGVPGRVAGIDVAPAPARGN